ncbi:hypothetical protein DENSPDRAFT_667522 [Dentipellis sp. KUC8613]|nr:hypothetical protein DENSPDRAFT_667522 [Dentipellis sp. KUC8613]
MDYNFPAPRLFKSRYINMPESERKLPRLHTHWKELGSFSIKDITTKASLTAVNRPANSDTEPELSSPESYTSLSTLAPFSIDTSLPAEDQRACGSKPGITTVVENVPEARPPSCEGYCDAYAQLRRVWESAPDSPLPYSFNGATAGDMRSLMEDDVIVYLDEYR